ncbi:MAG: hypothetical protein H7Z20_06800 [Bdellovibrio sp.]|nr:hypothetical protein [Methylotenera sp.]
MARITLNKILINGLILGLLTATTAFAVGAVKTYTENEFLDKFSGKTKTVIAEKLGVPAKKELSVKPSNASAMVGGKDVDDGKSKKVKVEMWYYKNIVKYDPKHTYKETEITFVNDRVLNIAFFNNK